MTTIFGGLNGYAYGPFYNFGLPKFLIGTAQWPILAHSIT
jgi:hypothetical protein